MLDFLKKMLGAGNDAKLKKLEKTEACDPEVATF